MTIICKNCHHSFKGHYCNNCGQSAETHKLNLHYVWHDLQHGLFHFDNGIAYTAKELFTRPGHSIREFIEGKRIKHFKPISLVVVLATIYIAFIHLLHIDLFEKTSPSSDAEYQVTTEILKEWLISHYAWITLLSIPLHTIGTALFFRKQGYNFVEYFILNTYKAGQKLYLSILCLPLLYLYSGTPAIEGLNRTLIVIDFLLYFWTNAQFFNHLSKTKTFFLTLFTHIVFWILLFVLLMVTILIINKG